MSRALQADALVAEIGSTTTLVSAFCGLASAPRFLGQGAAMSTAARGDALIGLEAAMEELKRALGVEEIHCGEMLAASSAAGGLSMSVHGLVHDMTARAAKEAALGAGAVIRLVTAGKMSPADQEALIRLHPRLILLAGGTDWGDRETALFNAGQIAALRMTDVPVIFAGNIQCRDEVGAVFAAAGIDCETTENVYPRLDELNIEPARKIIHRLFEKHIVSAPGMSRIRDRVSGAVLPTPGAVMEMARLLYPSLGGLLVMDIGGATTDLHSACEETEGVAPLQTRPEPLFKRTVEGDLGVCLNARALAERVGLERLDAELHFNVEAALSEVGPVPLDERQLRLAERLALEAGTAAILRHAGSWRDLYLPSGRRRVAEGKDLSGAKTLIATGGALTRLPGRARLLRAFADVNASKRLLYPAPGEMEIRVDAHYVMAALGVLGRKYPEAAVELMLDSFRAEEGAGG